MGYQPSTILKLIDRGLNHHIGGTFLGTKRRGKWIETTAGEFREKVRFFALGLHSLGVESGDRVSIHAENSTEWVICDQAILSIGAANVPIYTTQPGDQIRYILENSKSKVHIVSNDELFADTKSLIKSITNVEAVITLFGSKHRKLREFEAILAMGKKTDEENPRLFEELKSKVKPDDVATLIYTSGTTGDPKGVMLTHNNIASNLQASLERVPFDADPDPGQQMLSYLPLSHVFERLITYIYLTLGYPVYYIEDVNEIRDDFAEIKPYFFATVPRLLEKINTGIKVRGQEFSGLKKRLYYWAVQLAENHDPEHPPAGLDAVKHKIADKLVYAKIRELFGGKLMGMISGGAALSPDIFRFINALGIYCGQGYGLTETSPVISVTDRGHMRVGTSGQPLSNVEVKIADDGEILTRGPNVMKGYFRDEVKTGEVFNDEGWLMTGDIGKLDGDGYLYITDRKKSVFKLSTGKFVTPQPMENRLTGSGYIEQAVVVGYQRKFCSALIVPNYENVRKRLKDRGAGLSGDLSSDPSVRDLIQKEVDKVNRDFSPWERVKKFELLEKPLSIENGELTPTLKIRRSVIGERYRAEIDSIYEEEKDTSVNRKYHGPSR